MPKANDTSIFTYDEMPSLLDYLFGSDIDNNKKNRSYTIRSIIQLVNGTNGKNNVQFEFSNGSNPDITNLTPGYFFTDTNETNLENFTQLIFNKETILPLDLSLLFNKIGELENVVLKLENPEDPNNFFNLKVVSFENHTAYFVFGVQSFNNFYLGELTNEKTYSLYFDIKNASNAEDKFTNVGTISLAANVVTFSTGFGWEINGGTYANPVNYNNTIPYSSIGKQRFVLFVANVFNTFDRIMGPESISNPVAPPIPDNTLQVTLLLVTDGTISDPTPPISGDNYVKKAESQDFIANYGATTVINQIDLIDDRSSISLIGSATDVKSVQLSGEFIRPGKPHFFKNRTGHDVTLWHLAGTGNIKYFFPNELDLIVKPNEVIHFNINANDSGNVRFEYVGVSGKEDMSNKQNSLGIDGAGIKYPTVDYVNKVIGYVTPEQFGAIGDGVADDTPAFINALAASNHVYTLSGSTYLIGDVDVIGKKVYGNGIIRKKAVSECAFHLKGRNSMISTVEFDAEPDIPQPSGDIKLGDGAKNIVISGCTFSSKIYSAIIGSHDTVEGGALYTNKVDGVLILGNIFTEVLDGAMGYDRPIFLHSVSNIMIQSNIIRDTQRDAIRLRENNGNCIIAGNTFINIGNPAWVDSQTRDAIDVYWSGNTLTIANNIVTKTAFAGFDIKGSNAAGTDKTSRVIVTGNQISNTRYNGIFIQGNKEDSNYYYIESLIVANNIITNCNQDGGTSGHGIYCDGMTRYANIHDNIVTETKGRGIFFNNAYPLTVLGIKNIKITGNQCYNNGREGVTTLSEAGIHLSSIDGVILKDNICNNDTALPNPFQACGIYINSTSTGFPTSKSMIMDNNICRHNLTGQIHMDANNQRADNIASFEGNIQEGPGAVNRVTWQDHRGSFWGNGIPSTGDGIFRRGDIIRNVAPSIVGNTGNRYVISGWKRVSATGSTHVLNTDWVQLRTFIDNVEYAPLSSPALTGAPTAPTPSTPTGIANKAYVDANLGASGSYTPTLTPTNATSVVLQYATYQKIGNIVTVRISVDFTPTSTTLYSNIVCTLPFARATGVTNNMGSGIIFDTSGQKTALVQSIATTTATLIGLTGATTAGTTISAVFQYSILE